MYNAVNKIVALVALSLVFVCGCSKNADNGAHTLVDSIHKNIDEGKFEQAFALIDSLNVKYPDSIDLRKRMMSVKAEAQVKQAMSLLPIWTARVDSINVAITDATKDFVQKTTSATMGSYLVHRDVASIDLAAARTAIQPRVVDNDTPWLIAVTLASPARPTAIRLDADGGSPTEITINADACIQSDGTWRCTIAPESAAVFALALQQNNASSATLIITDAKGKEHRIALNEKMIGAIIASNHLANLQAQDFYAKATCEKLSRRLQLARDQQANDGRATSSLPE